MHHLEGVLQFILFLEGAGIQVGLASDVVYQPFRRCLPLLLPSGNKYVLCGSHQPCSGRSHVFFRIFLEIAYVLKGIGQFIFCCKLFLRCVFLFSQQAEQMLMQDFKAGIQVVKDFPLLPGIILYSFSVLLHVIQQSGCPGHHFIHCIIGAIAGKDALPLYTDCTGFFRHREFIRRKASRSGLKAQYFFLKGIHQGYRLFRIPFFLLFQLRNHVPDFVLYPLPSCFRLQGRCP